tara:strand:+ start:85 stop:996 length:912 start_codon:yes stop_codon:yes gene_type:complete
MKMIRYYSLIFLLTIVTISGQNYYSKEKKFIRDVHTALVYFRVPHVTHKTVFNEGLNNNKIFELNIKSRRNNFEEILMLGFSCVGKVMSRELSKDYNSDMPPILPSIVIINCDIPVGRNGTILSVSTNAALVTQFIEGSLTASQFWIELKNSFQYSSDIGVTSGEPDILSADVDFENLISARIAMESKNNPRVSNLISMANKASYIPGLQGRLESMLMGHMKSNHTDLMTEVIGDIPSDTEMLRIGKLVFFHVGHSIDEIIDVHTNDSLRYVWGGRVYPKPLDLYYDQYYQKNDFPRPRRSIR